MSELSKQIIAMLFISPDGLSLAELADACEVSRDNIVESKGEIYDYLNKSGLELIEHDNVLQLAARQSVIPNKFKPPIKKEVLSPAALEVLSIIAYKQPISRTEIEEIRGVGATQSIRGLLEKALISEKKSTKSGIKITEYITTKEFLKHLGISSLNDLPSSNSSEVK